ncbi:MAG: DNA mismatch repair endonuclease MutL [Chloroflexia bacterium]|nr:DNA mismatch repair endonuclease MutL [Chloroflexia bacterium]
MSIQMLAPDVVAKIAAGEVVERPASVVKELLENALDAGAGTVRIEIQGGGRREIRLVDDGGGIPEGEIELACTRHATSKISAADDLFNIHTLGFRGEALASIAAVSHFTLVSRPAGQEVGVEVRVDGGEFKGRTPRACTIGTIVTVRDLFFNTPARLKFMRQARTETGYINALVSDYALAHPQVALHLLSDGRTLLQTHGSGELYDALIEVYGLETAQQMLAVEGELGRGVERVRVSGYVSEPALSRATRRAMTLFVNGRRIRDRSLTYAVEEAYHTLLMKGRHPLVVIQIEVDPALVDVNVHPTKSEVKFAHANLVFSAVQRTVRAALQEQAPIPRIARVRSDTPTIQPEPPVRRRPAGPPARASAPLFPPDAEGAVTLPPRPRVGGPLFVEETPGEETEVVIGAGEAEAGWVEAGGEPADTEVVIAGEEAAAPAQGPVEERLPPLRVVGQMAGSYILAEGPDGLYLVDQHAAHERVLYEQLLAQRRRLSVRRQALLEPLVVELTPPQQAMLGERLEELRDWGFELEPFGERAYKVRAVPAILARRDMRVQVATLLEEWSEGLQQGHSWDEQLLTTIACHSAVRAGKVLSLEEMRELIQLLERSTMPRTCPHGRPTMLLLTRGQLEKEFRRR